MLRSWAPSVAAVAATATPAGSARIAANTLSRTRVASSGSV
ncbi:hypothetical protein JOF53_002855 [Crossiella equi]|uniref:Uncharacterized protein n=1 Tax=Crossiella equi TaxID=130796 RepID=A0ABS5ABN2_9PSEU|nr:hypothetical protein [Crossiella equi]MBP2473983.1 hypothetical protein [Crossiella equi]